MQITARMAKIATRIMVESLGRFRPVRFLAINLSDAVIVHCDRFEH